MQSWLLCAKLILHETSVRYRAETVLALRESTCRVVLWGGLGGEFYTDGAPQLSAQTIAVHFTPYGLPSLASHGHLSDLHSSSAFIGRKVDFFYVNNLCSYIYCPFTLFYAAFQPFKSLTLEKYIFSSCILKSLFYRISSICHSEVIECSCDNLHQLILI